MGSHLNLINDVFLSLTIVEIAGLRAVPSHNYVLSGKLLID